MTLRKRADVFIADLRADGGPRLSLHTKDKDVARVIYNEVEQRVLKGSPVDAHVVSALLLSYGARAASTAVAIPGATAVPTMRPSVSVSLRQAFLIAKEEREKWKLSRSFLAIERTFEHVAQHFGYERPLASITSGDTAAWRKLMQAQGLGATTINARYSLLSVLFEEVAVQHDITGDPKYLVTRPRLKRLTPPAPRKRILSEAEEVTVLCSLRGSGDHQMADLVAVLLDTGFRLSEALAINPRDPQLVDWETGMVWARETKTSQDRPVPMTERVKAILTARPEAFLDMNVAAADYRWAAMREAIGYEGEHEFVIHALRHTCCTRMVNAGFNTFKIMKWMGHKNIATTQRYVALCGADLELLKGAHESVPMAQPERTMTAQALVKSPEKTTGTDPEVELMRSQEIHNSFDYRSGAAGRAA